MACKLLLVPLVMAMPDLDTEDHIKHPIDRSAAIALRLAMFFLERSANPEAREVEKYALYGWHLLANEWDIFGPVRPRILTPDELNCLAQSCRNMARIIELANISPGCKAGLHPARRSRKWFQFWKA